MNYSKAFPYPGECPAADIRAKAGAPYCSWAMQGFVHICWEYKWYKEKVEADYDNNKK